jgi:hypothetical protein
VTDGRGKAGSCSASADCGLPEDLVIRELLSIQENEEFLIIVSLPGTQGFDVQITTQVAEYCAPLTQQPLLSLSSSIDFILN